MNDHIILEMDKNGGYVVDIIGLVYLLKKKMLPENSEVLSVLESGYQFSYTVHQEEGSFFLSADFEEDEENHDFLEGDEMEWISDYFEIDEDAMNATYYVNTAVATEFKPELINTQTDIHYENVHYEEALTRMKNGETVYLDYEEFDMQKMTVGDALSPAMVMDGLWFISEETKGIKKENLSLKESSFEDLMAVSPDRLSLLLINYLEEHERKVTKQTKIPKIEKTVLPEDIIQGFLDMTLLDFLTQDDEDYI